MRLFLNPIKDWWRGQRIDVSTGFHAATYYKRPWIARTLIALGQFWLRNWKILFPVIATAAVALFVHFHAFFNSANAPAVALKTSAPTVGVSVAGHHPANDHGGAKSPEEKQKMDKLDMHD